MARRIKIFIKVCLICGLLFKMQPSFAAEIVLNADKQFRFAEYLMATKDYERAILEYKRLLYYFPTSPVAKTATLKIGLGYYLKGPSLAGINYLTEQIKTTTDQELAAHLKYQLALFKLDYNYQAPFALREELITQGVQHLNEIEYLNGSPTGFAEFSQTWNNRQLEEKKTPWLAGAMSAVVPGSGSIYSQRYREGVYSFLLVAMFAWATHDAYHSQSSAYHNIYPLLGLLTVSFYGGSIYTAINSTHLYNSELELTYLTKLRDEHHIWLDELRYR